MTDSKPVPSGVILRAENGDVIGYDESGLVLRLADRVIADIAARLDLAPVDPAPATPADVPELPEDLDAWAIRQEGDWVLFQANLPGADSARGYRRHVEGGAILAESRGPLLGILGIGGARAGLASDELSAFPYHIFAPADDIGAVGMGGEGEADGGAGGGPDLDEGSDAHPEVIRAAGGVDQPHAVLFHPVIQVEPSRDFAGLADGIEGHDGRGRRHILDGGGEVQHQ